MWENSSAYSRVRFEDIAPITPKSRKGAQQTLTSTNIKISKLVNTNFGENTNKVKPTKANYNNIEKLILCLMETLQ
jgi:hypothetical protein